MAASFVAQSAVIYGTSALTVPKPTGTQEGDIIVLIHCHDDASDHVTNHWPSGFTEISGSPWTACGDHGFSAAYKIAGAGEPSEYTFTDSHNGEQQGAIAITLRGVDTADPIDAIAYACDSATAVIESPSVNVSNDGSFVICASGTGSYSHTRGFQDDAQFPDIPGSLSNAFYSGYDDTYFSLIGASGAFNSGATGTLDFGCDTGASENVSAVTIAFKPAAGSAVVEITGTIDAQSALQGALSVAREIAGSLAASSGVSGAIKLSKALVGAIASQSSIQAALGLSQKLTGTTAGQSLVEGIIGLVKALTGQITAQGGITGDLKADKELTGAAAAQTSVSGDLEAERKLAGAIDAQAAVAGQLSRIIELTGQVAAQAGASGDLEVSAEVLLSGIIAAEAAVGGSLSRALELTGAIAAQAGVSGDLSGWALYPDLLLELFDNLTGWTDGDKGAGVSEISPAGQLRMDTNASAANNDYCWQYRNLGAPPDKFTIEIRTYFYALGTVGDQDYFVFLYLGSDWSFMALFGSDGLFIRKMGGVDAEVGTNIVKCNESAAWQTWRFEVDKSGGVESATVEVFLKEGNGDFVSQGIFDCDWEWSSGAGQCSLALYGYTTDDRIAHVDYCLIATGNDAITVATDWGAPGTCSSETRSGSQAPWVNPDYAKVSDNNRATQYPTPAGYSDWLRGTNFGFSTSDIPSGATPIIIELKIEKSYASLATKDSSLRLRTAAGQKGGDKADTVSDWPEPAEEDYVYYEWQSGEIGDIDDADIRNSGFGIDFSAYANLPDPGSARNNVDHIQMRVWCIPSPAVVELTGTTAGQTALQGVLTASRKIAGAIAAQSGVSGALKASKELTGAIASESSVQAALKLTKAISGTVTGQSLIQGIIGLVKALTGQVAAQSVVSGALSVGAEVEITGTVDAQSTIEGDLETERKLTGTIDAQAGVTGDLEAAKKLTGQAAAQAAVDAELSRVLTLSGAIAAQSSTAGELTGAEVVLSGIIAAAATVDGGLSGIWALTGDIAAQAAVEGVLTVPEAGQRQSGMFLVI